MAFRIRKPDLESDQDFQASEQAYLNHLKSFDEQSHSSLWKYFATDFFHNGVIRSVSFSLGLKSLVMQIECPNIKRRMGDDCDYISLDFICEFRGVISFTLHNENPELVDTSYAESSTFIGSEINTAVPQELSDKKLCSLMIQTLEADRRIWIELVFSNLSITPEEPVAYAILESDPRFSIPVYTPEKQIHTS